MDRNIVLFCFSACFVESGTWSVARAAVETLKKPRAFRSDTLALSTEYQMAGLFSGKLHLP